MPQKTTNQAIIHSSFLLDLGMLGVLSLKEIVLPTYVWASSKMPKKKKEKKIGLPRTYTARRA